MNPSPSLHTSQKLFVRLLRLYPREYRDAFGPHMAQLFKDCSQEALSSDGTIGLINLWLATIPDLFKTAFEETFKEITHMSKEKFVRLGAYAYALGMLLLLLVFAMSSAETRYDDPLGGPDAWVEYFKLGGGPLALLLLFVGAAGLRSGYGASAGPLASAALSLAGLAALVSAAGALGLGLMIELNGWSWGAFFMGLMFHFLGVGVFGIVCMRRKLLPGASTLLALGGLLLPLVSLPVMLGLVGSNDSNAWVGQTAFAVVLVAMTAASLMLVGVQQKAGKPQAR
jgi:hypothetical protein